MAPSTKLTHLTERLRNRLHGDIKDIKPNDIIPDDNRSSDARVRFDENIELAIAKYGEKQVEKMLQHYYDKVKDIDHEAELRVWEMMSGPGLTFRDRAFKWGDKEEDTYKRAQRVRDVYKKSLSGREEVGGKKEQDVMARRAWELEKVKVEGGYGQQEEEENHPLGIRAQVMHGGGQQVTNPVIKPHAGRCCGAPAPSSRNEGHWREVMWAGETWVVQC